METSKFKTQFTKHQPSDLDFKGQESKTRLSEQDETDINRIMERFVRTGKLPAMQSQPARYGDARGVDYATALMIVKNAQDAFSKLPSATRRHFDNDPQQMEVFLADPKNHAKAVELGLMTYPKPSAEEILHDIKENTKKEAAPPKLQLQN